MFIKICGIRGGNFESRLMTINREYHHTDFSEMSENKAVNNQLFSSSNKKTKKKH